MKRFIEPLKTMQQHAEADRFVQGVWMRDKDDDGIFRGCFFGCAAQSERDPVGTISHRWGMPLWLGHLSETIFENLPTDEAMIWPVQLLEALVEAPEDFNFKRLECEININRLSILAENNPSVSDVINLCIDCWRQELAGDTDIDWESAESAAWSAAWSAESAAARSAVESAEEATEFAEEEAAESAAESAVWSAESASASSATARSAAESAESAAESAESAAARSAAELSESAAELLELFWINERDTLLMCLGVGDE